MSKLNDARLRTIKPTEKPQKYFDGGGLYLYVLPSGGKSWRIDYRYQGKYKTSTLGLYPTISLIEARRELAELKVKLKQGTDPQAEKKNIKHAIQCEKESIFEVIAESWLDKKQSDKSPKHRQDVMSKLEKYVYPFFHNRSINSITSREVLEVIRKIEAKELYETSKKVLGICSQIYTFGIGEGLAETNICAGLSSQLKSVKRVHYRFITDKTVFGRLLLDIDNYPNNLLVKTALQLAPRVFVRPSELVNAQWNEVDFDNALWTIPAERMKLRKKHAVPLSMQVLALLQNLHKATGDTSYLFANWNKKHKPITIEGVRKGLFILGYGEQITTHGFRHTASTMLNELGYNRDHIERQLAHSEGNSVRAVYNHAEYLAERRKMMQNWSNYLDDLRDKAK